MSGPLGVAGWAASSGQAFKQGERDEMDAGMKEQWKDIPGYVGAYQVSDAGRIRSLTRYVADAILGQKKIQGRVLKPAASASGHFTVALHNDGNQKTFYVHRLVAEAFFGPCPEGLEVCHGPRGLSDNSSLNLRYGTRSENSLDKRRDGTDNGRKVIRSDGQLFNSVTIAAEQSGCLATNIHKVCRGRYRTSGGFGWRYANEK